MQQLKQLKLQFERFLNTVSINFHLQSSPRLNGRLLLLGLGLQLGPGALEAEATLDRFHLDRFLLHSAAGQLPFLISSLAEPTAAQQTTPAGPASGRFLLRFAVDG